MHEPSGDDQIKECGGKNTLHTQQATNDKSLDIIKVAEFELVTIRLP